MSDCVDIIGNHIFGMGERTGCICKPKQVKLKSFSSEFDMEVWILVPSDIYLKHTHFQAWKDLKTMTKPINNEQSYMPKLWSLNSFLTKSIQASWRMADSSFRAENVQGEFGAAFPTWHPEDWLRYHRPHQEYF